jgi:hypothetical protein
MIVAWALLNFKGPRENQLLPTYGSSRNCLIYSRTYIAEPANTVEFHLISYLLVNANYLSGGMGVPRIIFSIIKLELIERRGDRTPAELINHYSPRYILHK